MVEAAVVFPIVVLTVMLLLYEMLFLFDETAAASSVRRAVVQEAGRAAGTVTLYDSGADTASAWTDVYGIRPCAAAEKTASFSSVMPGVADRSRTLRGHQYIYNEKTEIRLWDLFL